MLQIMSRYGDQAVGNPSNFEMKELASSSLAAALDLILLSGSVRLHVVNATISGLKALVSFWRASIRRLGAACPLQADQITANCTICVDLTEADAADEWFRSECLSVNDEFLPRIHPYKHLAITPSLSCVVLHLPGSTPLHDSYAAAIHGEAEPQRACAVIALSPFPPEALGTSDAQSRLRYLCVAGCVHIALLSPQPHRESFPFTLASANPQASTTAFSPPDWSSLLSLLSPSGRVDERGTPSCPSPLPGVWSVPARVELWLALMRLGAFGADAVASLAPLPVGPSDGVWGAAALTHEMRWDVGLALLSSLRALLGLSLPLSPPMTSNAAPPTGTVIDSIILRTLGGTSLWPAGLSLSSLLPYLSGSGRSDLPLPPTDLPLPVLSPLSRAACARLCVLAIGAGFPSLACTALAHALCSPQTVLPADDSKSPVAVSSPSVGEWLLLARTSEQCGNLRLAIHGYRQAARIMPDPSTVLLRASQLSDIAKSIPAMTALPHSESVPPPDPARTKAPAKEKPPKPDTTVIPLETGVPLSSSVLWEMQGWFYEALGVSAWGDDGPVPYDITSNAYIASQYAALALPLLPEVTPPRAGDTRGPHAHRLTVIELGAGHGKFGFLFLHHLKRMYDSWLGRSDAEWPSVKFVMTDFTHANVSVLQNHPCLAPFVDAGVLDFAVFDAITSTEVTLLESGETLQKNGTSRLLIVSNYFIDTLPADAYRVIDGKLHGGYVTSQLNLPHKYSGGVLPPDWPNTPYPAGGQASEADLRRLVANYPKTPLLHHGSIKFEWRPVSATEETPQTGEEVSSENPSRMEPSPFVATATVKSSELIGLEPLDSPALADRVIKATSAAFAASGVNRAFLHHVSALTCLQRLRSLWRKGDAEDDPSAFLLCVSDKGSACLSTSVCDYDDPEPYLATHGSVSLSVNFHSLAEVFRGQSECGFALLPDPIPRHNSIITAVFGQASASLRTAVTLASERSMTGLTPDGFYCLLDRLSPVSKRINAIRSNPNDPLADVTRDAKRTRLPLSSCLALLRLSLFDTGVFLSVAKAIQTHIASASPLDPQQEAAVVQALVLVSRQHYVVNPGDKMDALTEVARVIFLLGPAHYQHALSIVAEAQRVRDTLAKLFTRLYRTVGGSGSGYINRGCAEPQAKMMFVKAYILRAQGYTGEATALMETCAGIASKYRRTLSAWKSEASAATSAAIPSATQCARLSDAEIEAKLRLLVSKRLYFRRRLEENTRAALEAPGGSALGVGHTHELRLILNELEALNVEHEALLGEQQGREAMGKGVRPL